MYIFVYIKCPDDGDLKSCTQQVEIRGFSPGVYIVRNDGVLITDTWLKANHRKRRLEVLVRSDRDGLSIRVSPKGKIVFQMRYRYEGVEHPQRLDLGSYPRMSLLDARAENQRLRKELERGRDPKVVREVEKTALATADTIETLTRRWYEKYCSKHKKGHHEILRSFELHVFPRIGKLPAEEATLHAWLEVLEEQAEKRPAICERILVNAKQMLKWGKKRKYIMTNVLSELYAKEDFQIEKGENDRALADDEVRHVWEAIEQSRMALKNKLFMKLCLIYGCRNGELRMSKKSQFNFESMEWTIPRKQHKTGKKVRKPIVRPILEEFKPLIEQAMALSADSEYVFTNAGSNKPMGKGSPLQLPYNLMQWLRRHKKIEMEHWSVHSLRKTARTNFSALTTPHIAERMLGHELPKSWRVYDQYPYLEEMTQAYRAWWERLMKMVGVYPAVRERTFSTSSHAAISSVDQRL